MAPKVYRSLQKKKKKPLSKQPHLHHVHEHQNSKCCSWPSSSLCQRHAEALSPHPSTSQAPLICHGSHEAEGNSSPCPLFPSIPEPDESWLSVKEGTSPQRARWFHKQAVAGAAHGGAVSPHPAADGPDALSALRDASHAMAAAPGLLLHSLSHLQRTATAGSCCLQTAGETTPVGFHPPWAGAAPHGRQPLMIAQRQVRKALIVPELLLAYAILRKDCCSSAKRPGVLLTFCFACCSLWQLQQRDGSWQAETTSIYWGYKWIMNRSWIRTPYISILTLIMSKWDRFLTNKPCRDEKNSTFPAVYCKFSSGISSSEMLLLSLKKVELDLC